MRIFLIQPSGAGPLTTLPILLLSVVNLQYTASREGYLDTFRRLKCWSWGSEGPLLYAELRLPQQRQHAFPATLHARSPGFLLPPAGDPCLPRTHSVPSSGRPDTPEVPSSLAMSKGDPGYLSPCTFRLGAATCVDSPWIVEGDDLRSFYANSGWGLRTATGFTNL